jgi:hypothetical protein
MTRNHLRLCIGVLVLTPFVACESEKSANPLSPTVAGPIPGVNITPPKPLEPGNGWELKGDKQPVTLLLENASSNGVRPLSYVFEVAMDAAFGSKVFSKSGVAPGQAGRTSLQLTNSLTPGRTYYWRARAEDGANTGAFSNPVAFVLLQKVSIDRPVPLSPVRGETVGAVTELRFKNAPRSGPVGAISYSLEVSRNEGFTSVVWRGGTGERGGESSATTGGLPASATLFWRVRASDPENQGPWSSTASFVTAAPAPVPQPPSPEPPSSPPPGDGGSCASRDGNFIIACISNKYPSYLKAGVSSSKRTSNMEFLRDRIIEAGICGGLELGWNLKRGGPDISVDFITERRGGLTYGYDIARDYDNTRSRLQLAWQNDGPHSVQKAYSPRPSCN